MIGAARATPTVPAPTALFIRLLDDLFAKPENYEYSSLYIKSYSDINYNLCISHTLHIALHKYLLHLDCNEGV